MRRRLSVLLTIWCLALFTTSAQAAELLAVLELAGALPDDQRRAITDAVREEVTKTAQGTGVKVMTQ